MKVSENKEVMTRMIGSYLALQKKDRGDELLRFGSFKVSDNTFTLSEEFFRKYGEPGIKSYNKYISDLEEALKK